MLHRWIVRTEETNKVAGVVPAKALDHVFVRPFEFAMTVLAQAFSQSTLFEVRVEAGGVKFIWNF